MDQMNTQLAQKEESLQAVKSDNKKQLQEQMEAIAKEKANKAQVEQQMKMLEDQLSGVKNEFDLEK